jgi:dTDP-4-dehydrorhamnose reductase
MKILVIGRGWTGYKVLNNLHTKRYEAHIISHIDAFRYLKEYDVVINCAGVTGIPNVDACENDRNGTVMGNAVYPILLQQECEKHGVRFAHFSSGCIYTGIIEDVNATPNFFGSIYSVSKGVSDSYLKDKGLIFRIRMPFTGVDESKNYLTKVYNYAKNAKLYDSGQNSLTHLDEAIDVACDLVLENASYGAYNLVHDGSITMRELASLMNLDDAKWFTEDEFAKATRAGRSTCVIPAFERMSSLKDALNKALTTFKK